MCTFYDKQINAKKYEWKFGCVQILLVGDCINIYSGVRVIAGRILHGICLLISELAIRGTKLTLNARLGLKSNLLIQQYGVKPFLFLSFALVILMRKRA